MILGVGIEPDTPVEHLHEAVEALETDLAAIHTLATIDRRAGHPAILALAAGRTLRAYSPAELDRVEVPNPSAVIRRLVGTGSVAEAAAILAAREAGGAGELVVEKRRGRGVTVALAR